MYFNTLVRMFTWGVTPLHMFTDFASNIGEQKQVWVRRLWMAARDQMFVTRFTGTDENAMIQIVTELTKTERGLQAVIQLVADLVGDGRANDDELEGFEEALINYDQVMTLGQIAHSVRSKGELSDQASVIDFRSTGFDRLKYWLANRCDQLALLTLSGIAYTFNLDGSTRTDGAFASLAFGNDVRAPSSLRSLMWDGSVLSLSDTTQVATTFVPSYKMIVKALAYAKTHYVRPLMNGGKAYYVFVVHPLTLAAIKLDPDYQRAVVAVTLKDGMNSPWFTGAQVTIDGAVLHETNMTYNTNGAASGSKWGAGGLVNGTRTLVCGAQALGMFDMAPPKWTEKRFQYESQGGINVRKQLSFLKPEFYSIHDKSVQDFGVFTVDTALVQ